MQSRIALQLHYADASRAWYDSKYRPGYPESLSIVLGKYFNIDAETRILDLATGTGQVVKLFLKKVKHIVALDIDKDMLEYFSLKNGCYGDCRVSIIKGDANTLEKIKLPCNKFDLITVGRSFHLLNPDMVLPSVFQLLKHSGGIAIFDDSPLCGGLINGNGKSIKDIARTWLRENKLENRTTHPILIKQTYQEYLKMAGFKKVHTCEIEFEREWTIESIIGQIYATDICNLNQLSNKRQKFEKYLHDALIEFYPSGIYRESVVIQLITGMKNVIINNL